MIAFGSGMKALSIRQPWAWLIAHGHKDIENRRWKTCFRGSFAIHAGKKVDDSYLADLTDIFLTGIMKTAVFELGGIVGVAEIIDCVVDSDSEWFDGPWGFEIINARPIEFVPCPGRLGFFELPRHIAVKVCG